MEESILNTIKKMLGLLVDDTGFDVDIITNINSVFMILNQLGVGPESAFYIEDAILKWSDFLTDQETYMGVKTYVYLKVKLMFDPPSNSFYLASIERQVQELEWRLTTQVPIPPDSVI